ncbi:MAG: SpoIID/LytB domain-containing protein, partial [Planctomycetota bacterium]
MPRAALLLLALGPAARAAPFSEGVEPVVRVLLREQGKRESCDFRGDGGLLVEADGEVVDVAGGVSVARDGDRLRVSGVAGRPRSVLLAARAGLVFVEKRAYAGSVACRAGDGLEIVNRVGLENYVLGVLRGELPLRHVPVEAAAAQAVAVRSYALHYLAQGRAGHDVDDTVLFQRYDGVQRAPRDGELRAGVQATRGVYLAWDGKPLKAYYHSTCGGHTTDPRTGLGQENLAPLSGTACDRCRASKYFRWEIVVPDADVARAAGLSAPIRGVEVAERGAGGRVLAYRVAAGSGARTVPAGDFRMAVG